MNEEDPTPRLLLGTLAAVATLLGATVISEAALGATPVGPEFQVNTYTTLSQRFPSVEVGSDGDFVVVWRSNGSAGSDTSSKSVQGQRYDASGNAVGAEFQVNTFTTGAQLNPSLSVDSDGDFVVVWMSDGSAGSDTSFYSIQGQRYDSSGTVVGAQFQVNTYTPSFQSRPSVSVDSDGDFVVVWDSSGSAGSDTSGHSIQGQRYDASGSAIGSEFQVNSYTISSQAYPSVAVDADGDFVVVWESFGSAGSDTSDSSIQGQRYDASGSLIGSEFQVNTYTTSSQRFPSVEVDSDGDFVVVWDSSGSAGSDTSGTSVQGQRYDASGSAIGSEFQVNSYTTGNQGLFISSSVAVDADGDFVVVWWSYGSAGSDNSDYSIQGQRYDASGSVIGSQFQVNSYTTAAQDYPGVAVDANGDFVVVWESSGSAGSDNSFHSIQGQRYVPEPSGFLMLGVGLAFLAAVDRRRIRA